MLLLAVHRPPSEPHGVEVFVLYRSQKMLRVTVREDFSFELASDLINDLKTVIEWLDHHFIYSGRQSTCSSEPCSHAPTIPHTHVTVPLPA